VRQKRDLHDLLWYLSDPDRPDPNLILLNNALSQTHSHGPTLKEENWRDILRQRVEELEWRNARDDVAPFIERIQDLELLTRENPQRVLE